MPIVASELRRDFVVAEERETVGAVRDRVGATGNQWSYVVVRLADGRYAVFRLGELVEVLRKYSDAVLPEMLDTALVDVPDLLPPRAGDAVEQAAISTGEARAMRDRLPGRRLVVLAEGRVVGLLAVATRAARGGADPGWLSRPATRGEASFAVAESVQANGGGVLSAEARPEAPPPPVAAVEPEPRWINAEILDQDAGAPLRTGETYTLAFDVDTVARTTALAADPFRHQFGPDEQLVELTVQLSSADFEIYTEPQSLRVPRSGRSRNKARFDIAPKHDGVGILNAVFLKSGNFVQLMTLKLPVGAPADARPSALATETLGRPVDAAVVLQPRDVGLIVESAGSHFKMTMYGAVWATATIPITLPELDQMIAQVRRELHDIVHLAVGRRGSRPYQEGIDIPPEVNQQALQRLARAGCRLYQRIFYGQAADAAANLLGDKLRAMAQQERLKLQICSQQFVLPWGVLYLADTFDPNAVDPELFLGLKHIVEQIPLQPNMQVLDSRIGSQPMLTVGLNVNAAIDEQMRAPMVADQLRYWDGVQGRGARVVVRRTEAELMQALSDPATADQVLYFFCHAKSKSLTEGGGPDASSLHLEAFGGLTLGDLSLSPARRQPLPGAPLVFINACESAELSPLFYDGFVPFFMGKGARGVIGTECETPALFAAEWARRFFDRFLAGQSLGQVLLELRREFYYGHNNLMGLLYALYCDGDTQVVPGLQVG